MLGRNKARPILITAGPTREKIDPVRFISNYSTGTFGYEIASEAARRGMPVTLISGPTLLKPPDRAKFIPVESADDMYRAVIKEARRASCVIMAAAVSDWKVANQAKKKLKKRKGPIALRLVPNRDILEELGKRKTCPLVGFALETENMDNNAVKKLIAKRLDLIVANRHSGSKRVFGDDNTDISIIDRFGNKKAYKSKPKAELAKIILDKALGSNI